MTYSITAMKLIAASLAGFAFCGSAISQEAPYVAGNYSANTERLVSLEGWGREAAPIEQPIEESETATFAFDNEMLRFPRPRNLDEPVFGNYSANVRAHHLR